MVENTVIFGLRPCLVAACDTLTEEKFAAFRDSMNFSREEDEEVLGRLELDGRWPINV
jgi:hypothetical protein